MLPQLQNVKIILPNGQTQYFSGDPSGLASYGAANIYNAPLHGGQFYSGSASGYANAAKQAVFPYVDGQGVTQSAAPTGAIKSSGGFWVVPGSDKRYSSAPVDMDGIVTSSDIITGHNQIGATDSAVGVLTGRIDTQGQGLQTLDYLNQSITSSSQSFNKLMADIKQSVDSNYDANLGALNAQYRGLFDRLAQSHTNEVQAGTARAVALNPYSQSEQASTASGFTSVLNAKYEQQYRDLTAKMQAAQSQLAFGRTDEYLKIVKEASAAQQGFQRETRGFIQDYFQQQEQIRQFNVAQGGIAKRTATDDLFSIITKFSDSPEIKADISEYESSGKISPALMLVIKTGMEAEISPREAISMLKYQPDSVRKQQALEQYRIEQQDLASQRLALSQERQSRDQRTIATTQMVLQAQADMRAKGIEPNTIEWANGVAAATSASVKSLSPSQIGMYTKIGVLANQLTDIKKDIDAINSKDAIWNTLQTYAGRDISSITDSELASLNARLTALSGIIGKTFYGESGNLSNTDIQRVLSALPTGAGGADLRKALYNGLIKVAQDNSILILQNDAQAGYSIAPYIDGINKIAEQYTSVSDKKKTFVSPSSGKSYVMPKIFTSFN